MKPVPHFDDITPEVTQARPDPERRPKDNPLRVAREYFANDDHGVRAGTWEASIGAYRISLPADKHEFFHITKGEVIITAPDGSAARRFVAGDSGVIPPGFEGIFEIVSDASKFWVVAERS